MNVKVKFQWLNVYCTHIEILTKVNLFILLFRDASNNKLKHKGIRYWISIVKFFLDIQLSDRIINFSDYSTGYLERDFQKKKKNVMVL